MIPFTQIGSVVDGLRGGFETEKNSATSFREFCAAPFTLKHLTFLASFRGIGAGTHDSVIGMRSNHLKSTTAFSRAEDVVGCNRGRPSWFIADRYSFYILNYPRNTVVLKVGNRFLVRWFLADLLLDTTAGFPCLTKLLPQFSQGIPIRPLLSAWTWDFNPSNGRTGCRHRWACLVTAVILFYEWWLQYRSHRNLIRDER